ncbi:hypothetical protein Taro_005043 [Colocasia esculenta]|uniref:Uncharacterized protein n=1 Tax=Colocasia esculenta TaxID=4460 RepID=A0A843TRY1_COLES|nr:hypothetical protein [Colocasia esculenta]
MPIGAPLRLHLSKRTEGGLTPGQWRQLGDASELHRLGRWRGRCHAFAACPRTGTSTVRSAVLSKQQSYRALQAAELPPLSHAPPLTTPARPPPTHTSPPPLPIYTPHGGEEQERTKQQQSACGTSCVLYRVSADGGTSSPDLDFKVWCCIGDSGSRLSTSVGILLLLRFCCEMASSTAQSDSDLHDQYFEDWFSDVDPELLDINSSALVADYRQALDLIDSSTGGTSAPVLDAQAVASGTANSEFQVVSPLPGIDTSDSLSIHAPSPQTVSNPWSPPVASQTAWEPWPTE